MSEIPSAKPAPEEDWRSPEAFERRRLKRDVTRNYFRQASIGGSDLRSLIRSATCWLLPWTAMAYPGRQRGVRQLLELGEGSADRARRGFASRRSTLKLAAELERRGALGLEIASGLRSAIAALPARKPRGLCIIGEDGLRKHQAPRARAGGMTKRRESERPV